MKTVKAVHLMAAEYTRDVWQLLGWQ